MKKIGKLREVKHQHKFEIGPDLHQFKGAVEMFVASQGILVRQSNKVCILCGAFSVFQYREISLCPMCKDVIREG